MSKFGVFASLVFVGTALLPSLAIAKCENGAPQSYDDIRGIRFERWDCSSPPATNHKCSRYVMFVSNWENVQHQVAEYSQFNVGQTGRYELSVNAKQLISILQRYNFFELNPPSLFATDTPYSVLTVKRCAIVTRLAMPAALLSGDLKMDASYYATLDLFKAIDDFVQKAHKTMRSPKPDEEEWDWNWI